MSARGWRSLILLILIVCPHRDVGSLVKRSLYPMLFFFFFVVVVYGFSRTISVVVVMFGIWNVFGWKGHQHCDRCVGRPVVGWTHSISSWQVRLIWIACRYHFWTCWSISERLVWREQSSRCRFFSFNFFVCLCCLVDILTLKFVLSE